MSKSIFKLKAIKPGAMPTGQEYAKAMQKAVEKAASLALRDLEATTRTWVHKPAFDVTITEQGGSYGVTAGTDDAIAELHQLGGETFERGLVRDTRLEQGVAGANAVHITLEQRKVAGLGLRQQQVQKTTA